MSAQVRRLAISLNLRRAPTRTVWCFASRPQTEVKQRGALFHSACLTSRNAGDCPLAPRHRAGYARNSAAPITMGPRDSLAGGRGSGMPGRPGGAHRPHHRRGVGPVARHRRCRSCELARAFSVLDVKRGRKPPGHNGRGETPARACATRAKGGGATSLGTGEDARATLCAGAIPDAARINCQAPVTSPVPCCAGRRGAGRPRWRRERRPTPWPRWRPASYPPGW